MAAFILIYTYKFMVSYGGLSLWRPLAMASMNPTPLVDSTNILLLRTALLQFTAFPSRPPKTNGYAGTSTAAKQLCAYVYKKNV